MTRFPASYLAHFFNSPAVLRVALVAAILFLLTPAIVFAQSQEEMSEDPPQTLEALREQFEAEGRIVITPSVQGEQVVFRADKPLRYFADYTTYTVEIPDAVILDTQTPFPAGYKIFQPLEGVSIHIGGPFRIALSPDQTVLTIVRGETYGTAPQILGEHAKAPIMYYLSNADPAEVAGLLTSLYENLQVEIDTRQRALLVLVNPTDRVLVDALIEALDAPRPQVMFEAEILEINQDITRSLGIQYDSIFTFTLTEGPGGGLLRPGPVTRSPLTLNFGLNMLKVNGAADVLARPRITTLDGVEAQLNATQTVPVIVPGASGQQTVQNITTGITLRLLPKVSPDGYIEADLSISVSTPTGTTSQGVPQFSSREASTTVRVANGQPIAIGGLLEKRKIKGTSKVPILGDIPIIGALFTSTRTEWRETDLVIIVTPRIIDMQAMPSMPTISYDEATNGE